MVRQLRYITNRRKAALQNSPIHRKLKAFDRHLLLSGNGSVDWGVGHGGLAEEGGERDDLLNVNRGACKLICPSENGRFRSHRSGIHRTVITCKAKYSYKSEIGE